MGRARRYSYVGECTLPLCVLAIACTVRTEALRGVAERYASGHVGDRGRKPVPDDWFLDSHEATEFAVTMTSHSARTSLDEMTSDEIR